MIKYILWDIDNTLLSFDLAERAAMTSGFDKFSIGIEDEKALYIYKLINDKYWKMLESGQMSRDQILTGRFKELFDQYEINYDDSLINDFNHFYQEELGRQVFFNDHAQEVLEVLGKNYKQYAVTNGTKLAQKGKLKNSGLDKVFDGIFISEDLGVDKPNKEFFYKVFEKVGSTNPDEYIIVGDSLTSDMRGANNAGITNIWYNPKDLENNTDVKINFCIHSLDKIPNILDDLNEK